MAPSLDKDGVDEYNVFGSEFINHSFQCNHALSEYI